MVLDFKDKVSKHEEIYVPYSHPLLRLNHNQMVCLGRKVNGLRSEYYAILDLLQEKSLTTQEICAVASRFVFL